jgi:WD40 repeat protein
MTQHSARWQLLRSGLQVGCFSSLLSYSAHEGAVTDVKLLSDDKMDSVNVASIDSTGQLHLWDVSVQPRKPVSQRPTLAFPPASPSHFNLDCGSLTRLQVWGPLLLASSECGGISAYDPRAGAREVWKMEVPAHHGVTTCMAAVPGAPALCSGTTRGMMHVWDMRMQVCFLPCSWGVGESVHDSMKTCMQYIASHQQHVSLRFYFCICQNSVSLPLGSMMTCIPGMEGYQPGPKQLREDSSILEHIARDRGKVVAPAPDYRDRESLFLAPFFPKI